MPQTTTATATAPPAARPRLQDGDRLAPMARSITLQRRAAADAAAVDVQTSAIEGLDVGARTLTFSWSSEAPVPRWFGNEVLSHDASGPDLSRLNDGANLLFNHNRDDVLGVVEKAWLGTDRRCYATVRFAKTPRGDEVLGMVADGILRNVSFLYEVDAYTIESDDEDPYYDPDAIWTGTRWLTYELSIVTIPADQSVGVSRSQAGEGDATSHRVRVTTRAVPHPSATAATRSAAVGVPAPVPSPVPTHQEDSMLSKMHRRVLNAQVEGATAGGAAVSNTETAVDGAMRLERTRVDDIVALGRAHSLPLEQVHGMITRGLDIGAARGEVLANILQRNPQNPVASLGTSPNPDLTPREQKSYSLVRAVAAVVAGNWEHAGFEREVSNEIAKRSGKTSTTGFFMPSNLPFAPSEEHLRAWQMMGGGQRGGQQMQYRAPYQVGTAAQGGNLVQTQLLYDQFIEVLRNQLVTAQLGARYLTGLSGNIDIPRQITQTGTYWVGESGAPTETEATFDKVSLRPRTIGAISKMSRLMLLQSSPAIEMIAREDLIKVMALGIDAVSLYGTGASNQPTGIVNQAGVSAVVGGANGANLTFDHLIQLQYASKFANAPQGAAAYAMNSKSVGYLSTQKATTGQYLWEPQGGLTTGSPDKVKGRPYAESQQLRSTLTKGSSSGICSEIIYGNWQELFIAEWGVTEIMVNPYDSTGFANGDVIIRAFQTCDIGVRHGASFSVMSDALTPGF